MESNDFMNEAETFLKLPITVDPVKMTKWINEEAGPIMYLMFGITYECQCSCRHCCTGNYPKETSRDLT
ncbi:MAG: hypothetical protein ACW990_01835, partial [Promethearchaeota archaeon]